MKMTNEEAKEIIDKVISDADKLPYYINSESKVGKALAVAVEALEKSIPKKIHQEHYYFGTLYVCPECGMSFGARDVALDKRYKGCPYCLQAIDWSEEND